MESIDTNNVDCNYEQILELEGVTFETVIYDNDRMGYRFRPVPGISIKDLTKGELEILDAVVKEVGHLNPQEIIKKCMKKMLTNVQTITVTSHLLLQRNFHYTEIIHKSN